MRRKLVVVVVTLTGALAKRGTGRRRHRSAGGRLADERGRRVPYHAGQQRNGLHGGIGAHVLVGPRAPGRGTGYRFPYRNGAVRLFAGNAASVIDVPW